MDELYYSALDLAILVSARELTEKEIAKFLEAVWEKIMIILLRSTEIIFEN